MQSLPLSAFSDSVIIVNCSEGMKNRTLIFSTGELATSWYILLSGSVFIDGSMFLPRSR
jgi:hypothetical protein